MTKLADTAASFGYEWLCVTERAAPQSNGLNNDGLSQHIDAIARFNDGHHPVRLLSGIEVAIDQNGLFGLDVRLISQCDFVVARLVTPDDDPDLNTQRIIWAFESGIVSMLSAPTGRRLGSNDGYPIYFDEIIDQAVDFGVALEMNGHPSFLDLNAINARRARERGALIALGSDANNALGMSNISYAVQQAKRAWFEPNHVLNCLSAHDVVKRVRNLR